VVVRILAVVVSVCFDSRSAMTVWEIGKGIPPANISGLKRQARLSRLTTCGIAHGWHREYPPDELRCGWGRNRCPCNRYLGLPFKQFNLPCTQLVRVLLQRCWHQMRKQRAPHPLRDQFSNRCPVLENPRSLTKPPSQRGDSNRASLP